MKIVILGLSITSSWGNGHATTYRGLVRALAERGHTVLFLERDVPWYRDNRDLPNPPHGQTELYDSLEDLQTRFRRAVERADAVIVGSYVPEGIAVAEWVLSAASGVSAFYDIDTPVTLASLRRAECAYLQADLIPRFDLYLSFTGGPTLDYLEDCYGAATARPLYCSVDPELYYPQTLGRRWDLGYLGTYSDDRQPPLERLLLDAARRAWDMRFVVAGPLYPEGVCWPSNCERIEHLPPDRHRAFYNSQRFTLNVTRIAMIRAGYSPSVRLFEAAACGVPIISDHWEGLETVFEIGKEILVAYRAEDTLAWLRNLSEADRLDIGQRARQRVLSEHTAAHRAVQLEGYLSEARSPTPPARTTGY